jgi:colicin import membrane protein
MRGPTLQRATIVSFALHLTFFLIAFFVLRQANHMIMPSPYTVNLVGTEVLKVRDRAEVQDFTQEPRKAAAPSDISGKKEKDVAGEKERIEKKIAAIEAKKKVEKLVKLRSMISLKAGGDTSSSNVKTAAASQGKGSLFDEYYARITKEIRQQWIFPDMGRKEIEAIVSVKILKDGTARVQRIEKSSGNALFDRSALKALAKASPLPPPPYEMEIGVRFYP